MGETETSCLGQNTNDSKTCGNINEPGDESRVPGLTWGMHEGVHVRVQCTRHCRWPLRTPVETRLKGRRIKASLLWEREYKERCGNRDRVISFNPSPHVFVRSSCSRDLKRFGKVNEWAVLSNTFTLTNLSGFHSSSWSRVFDARGTKYMSSDLPIQWRDLPHVTHHILPNTHYYNTQTLTWVERISLIANEQVWIIMCDI